MSKQIVKPLPTKRKFLPTDFKLTQWISLKPFYEQLLQRELDTVEDFLTWLADRSELEGMIEEDAGWRYINMTRDTTHEGYRQQYEAYIQDILPSIMPLSHQLDQKAMECPHLQTIKQQECFRLWVRCLENSIRLYQPDNIPLLTKLQIECQNYSHLVGCMTIELGGKELTLQQASVYLESPKQAFRREVYNKINQRRLQNKDEIDSLYSSLIKDRHQVALNAGFANYRDYTFFSLRRFDYTPEDCFAFHQGIEETSVPFMNELAQERQSQLGVASLKPWDHTIDPTGKPPLRPFKDTQELLQKTITVFDRLDPFLGDCLRIMEDMQHFDLDSRKGKAPGGYNYPLLETGVPFIFMNATSSFQDMVTMIHEAGHAIHAFLMHDLPLNDFKHITSEMAELASMSIELLTIDQWHLFFEQEDDLRRAKKQHLAGLISKLAWIATIDQFQHWVYENPQHTSEQRKVAWNKIFDRFSDKVTSWSGQEAFKDLIWQKQLHLFEVPFYYIEYGIAQLGAIAIWKNFQQNPQQTLQQYLHALRLGYTRSLPEIYQAAGIRFDFSPTYIQELVNFVIQQWKAI